MKAILLQPGTTKMHIGNVEEPFIMHPSQIKLRVLQVGICGTDREEAAGGRADAPKGHSELVIGHEMLGKIVEVGKEVKSVKAGEYGVLMVRRGCRKCIACREGRSDMCFSGDYAERGIKELDGYNTEYVIDEAEYFIKTDNSIAAIAVLTEPLSIIEKAMAEIERVQSARMSFLSKDQIFKGRKAIVAGLGPVGLLAAVALKLRGAEVFGLDVVDENSNRVKLLNSLSGKYINDKKRSIHQIKKDEGTFGIIVEATGVAKLEFNLLDALGANGIYVLTGIPGGDSCINISGAELVRKMVLKNQVLLGSVNASKKHYEMAVEDLKKASLVWPGLLEQMITSKYKVEDFKDALTTHDENEIKAVIEWEEINLFTAAK